MIVLDACTIISFRNAGRLDLIDGLQLDSVCVSARARMEVVREPARAAMGASIAAGRLSVGSINLEISGEQDGLRDFSTRPAFRGRGDAGCSLSQPAGDTSLHLTSARYDQLFSMNGGAAHLAGTADFIVWAVRKGRLTIAEAETVLAQPDSGVAVLAPLKRQGRTLGDYATSTRL